MEAKKFLTGCFSIVLVCVAAVAVMVYYVDPYFHYHAPRTDKFYYELYDQRCQNDGILRYFDYDAIITGTSMTENFKTSEMDALWGTKSVKTPYSGGSYKEINDSLSRALKTHPNTRMIIRSLDYTHLMDDSDLMREDLGTYPTYLYDDNLYNDVNYLVNKTAAMRSLVAVMRYVRGGAGGIDTFDSYSNWSDRNTYGQDTVIPDGMDVDMDAVQKHLTQAERDTIKENISQNVTDLVKEYPEVEFNYFFPPYSVVYWGALLNDGSLERQVEAEEYALEMMLDIDNLHIYSFSDCFEITTDLNNYVDRSHYGGWINSYILESMYAGEHRLTRDNYKAYLERERELYSTYDYDTLNMGK